MKSILDPTFVYTPAALTDIRKTFAKAKKELQQKEGYWDPKGQPSPPLNPVVKLVTTTGEKK